MRTFDVFISYSHDDKDWAQRFAGALKQRGVQVWLDKEQLKPGTNWRSAILRGLKRSQHVVTIVDPKDISRPRTYFEAGMAIGLDKKVTFVVPEHSISRDPVPFDVSKEMIVRRRTPDLTAKEVLTQVVR